MNPPTTDTTAAPDTLGGGKMDPAAVDARFGYGAHGVKPTKRRRGRKGKSAPEGPAAKGEAARTDELDGLFARLKEGPESTREKCDVEQRISGLLTDEEAGAVDLGPAEETGDVPLWHTDPDEPLQMLLCAPELLDSAAAPPDLSPPDSDGDQSAILPPFPWFGGKSRASALIWGRLGGVANYVEAFAGSLAILLARPTPPQIETVNDRDRYLANFWRAVRADPDAVAEAAACPVNEADLEARHYWLVSEGAKRLAVLLTDPRGYDAEIAGWWVWGQCCWIGSGWCSGEGPWVVGANGWELGNAGQGVNRQLPHLGDAGQGVNRKLPHLGDAGKGVRDYLRLLSARLERVRVACGDWTRVLTPSVTFRHGPTAVVLDPPYGEGEVDYSAGGNRTDIAAQVRDWAVANGDNPDLRIALCGYAGQHDMPADWTVAEWKAAGGYSSTAAKETQGKKNRHRERVWFSPHCLKPDSAELAQLSLPGFAAA